MHATHDSKVRRVTTKAMSITFALMVLGLCTTLTATPALAARGHIFGRSFGWGVVNGNSELQTCTTGCRTGLAGSGLGQLSEPTGVAVSAATGDVYVMDQGNTRVERFKLNKNTGSYEYEGQFDGSGEFEVEGKKEKGIAAGFGKLVGEVETGKFAKPEGHIFVGIEVISIAVDNEVGSPSFGDVYVADVAHEVVDKFTQTGEYVGQLSFQGGQEPTLIDGLAVDAVGQLWVATHAGTDFRYSNEQDNKLLGTVTGTLPGQFNTQGFAVDANDDLYLHSLAPETENGPVFEIGAGGCAQPTCKQAELLSEVVDGESSEGIAVELSSGDVYVNNSSSVARFGPAVDGASPSLERMPVPGAGGSGVAVGSGPGPVYVTESAKALVDEFELEPPSTPTIQGEAVKKVTGESATLEAEVNPRSESNEEPTSYIFQYTTEEQFAREGFAGAASVPLRELPPNYEPDLVTAEATGLAARTTYHFRVVAENKISREGKKPTEGERNGSGEEVLHTFTTQPGGELVLPDEREWELVSPLNKHGADLLSGSFEGAIQAAANGEAVSFGASGPTETTPEGNDNETQVFATRGGTGWASRDMTLPHNAATGASLGTGGEFRLFSQDLSLSIAQPFGAFQALSPQATEQTAYVRSDYLNGNVEEPCMSASMSCYTPLVSTEDETSGKPFGEEGKCPHSNVGGGEGKQICGPLFVGASPDLSHIVVSSSVGLTAGVGSGGGLYEWTGGELTFIGGGEIGSSEGAAIKSSRGAVSTDGSRVVWSEPGGGHLFLRDLVKEATLKLDVPEAHCLAIHTCGGGSQKPKYQLASNDGSRVFFKDTQALTEGSRSYSSGETDGDLYECAVVEEAGKLKCDLTDLTPGVDVQSKAIGASEDGSWLYFTAGGVLTTTPDSRGEKAVSGECQGEGRGVRVSAESSCNLYVRHDGTTRLVAVLSAADGADINGPSLAGLTAKVSPNGLWLAFSSERQLTGYDNRDTASGRPDQEIFLYDAEADGGAGQVVCASCDPTGARPHGIEYGRVGLLASGQSVWEENQWVAAMLPGWTTYELGRSLYQPRYLSNSGRLFFNSDDELVPQDVNGTWDVYEYQPPGIGNCATTSVSYSERSGGCVGLISSGASPEESALLDASETGGDVFFLTAAKLVTDDTDTAVDLYDAHECTAASPCLPPSAGKEVPCTTADSCRPAPTPQPEIFGAPPSATFIGPGNLSPLPPSPSPAKTTKCKKGFTRRHGKCVKNPRKCKKSARNKHGKCPTSAHKSAKRSTKAGK
jgi:hypothetical protein